MTTDSSTGDWTPGRERAIRERCERDTVYEALRAMQEHLAGDDDAAMSDLSDLVNRAAEDHEERDLPAALREIERLNHRLRHAHDAANRLYRVAGTLCAAVENLDDFAIDDPEGPELMTSLEACRAAIDPAEQAAALAEVQRRDGLEREIERLRAELAAARAPELDESTSYGWARQALRPVQDIAELHRYEQALDKVASAVREAWARRGEVKP